MRARERCDTSDHMNVSMSLSTNPQKKMPTRKRKRTGSYLLYNELHNNGLTTDWGSKEQVALLRSNEQLRIVDLRQKCRERDKTSENHQPKMDLAQMLQTYWPY